MHRSLKGQLIQVKRKHTFALTPPIADNSHLATDIVWGFIESGLKISSGETAELKDLTTPS